MQIHKCMGASKNQDFSGALCNIKNIFALTEKL